MSTGHELRHKRLVAILQLCVGISSASIISLIGFWASDGDANLRNLAISSSVGMVFIGIFAFVYLNNLLEQTEEKAGLGA